MDKMRDAATAQLSSQKDRATDGLGSISQAVRQSTHQLRDQEHDVLAHYVEQAAEQMDRLSRRLRDRDVGDLVGDIHQMARRRPALFIGGAFAVGLIGARFLKSSGRMASDGRESGTGPGRSPRRGTGSMPADRGTNDNDFTMATNDAGMETEGGTGAGSARASSTRSRRSTQFERP